MAELVRTNKEPVRSSAILTPELQVTDGLVSYWPMLKNQGTTLFDRNGNNNGTINGATWDNGALDFDGTDDYVDTNSRFSNVLDGDFTIAGWFNLDSSPTEAILYGNWYVNSIFNIERLSNGNLRLCSGTSVTCVDTGIDISGATGWFHLVVVREISSPEIRIYIDTSKDYSTSNAANTTCVNNYNLYFGRDAREATTRPYGGQIDDVRIYDRALSTTEIQTIYNRGRKTHNQRTLIPVDTDGLVGYWPMTQGSGGTLYDESKNGNDGTIEGASWADTANGKALEFDGVDDYVEVGDLNDTLNNVSQFSINLWVNLDSYSTSSSSPDDHQYINIGEGPYILTRNSEWLAGFYGQDDTWHEMTSSTNLNTGNWHHLVLMFNKPDLKLYIDGSVVGPISVNTNTNYYNNSIGRVGAAARSSLDGFADGIIDEVRIYDRALSAQEITNIYEKTRGLYGV